MTCLMGGSGLWQRLMRERMVMGRERERWSTRLMSDSRLLEEEEEGGGGLGRNSWTEGATRSDRTSSTVAIPSSPKL